METDGRVSIQTDRRMDGRTDMTKIIGAFRDCVNGPKNYFKLKEKNLSFHTRASVNLATQRIFTILCTIVQTTNF